MCPPSLWTTRLAGRPYHPLMRQGAQHVMPRKGIPLVLVVVALACSGATVVDGSVAAPGASVTVTIPPLPVGKMHLTESTKTGEQATLDATDPQAMLTTANDAGLVGVREQVYTGGRGSYSRVVVRAWEFPTSDGAAQFLTWIDGNATESAIGKAKPVASVPGLYVHEPTG